MKIYIVADGEGISGVVSSEENGILLEAVSKNSDD